MDEQPRLNLKDYVDVRIKELAEYSNRFSDQYLAGRDELQRRIQEARGITAEIKNTVHIFN
jgi:hypothetical protein